MIAFDMNHEILATFLAEEGTAPKTVCKMTGNGTVAPAQADDSFCGVVSTVRGGYAGVVLHGFVTVTYSGTAPAAGKVGLVADGEGGVKVGEGESYLVVDVDENAKTAKLFL